MIDAKQAYNKSKLSSSIGVINLTSKISRSIDNACANGLFCVNVTTEEHSDETISTVIENLVKQKYTAVLSFKKYIFIDWSIKEKG